MNSVKSVANAITRMPSRKYLAYMRSDQWKRVRDEHLERCDRWCEICHNAKATQVHHTTYVRLGWEYPQDLCAVCVKCHHDIHTSIFKPANDNQMTFLFPVQKKA